INRNTTCPSACCHREPATTNASPAALSITSNDIRTKSKLRRTSRLVSPSENKIPASISPSLIGICVMLSLRCHNFQEAQVICAYHAREQQHRGEFHPYHVRAEQNHPHFLWSDSNGACIRRAAFQQINDLGKQDPGQKHGPNPNARSQPLPLRLDGLLAQVEHHAREHKEHHNGARVDDNL